MFQAQIPPSVNVRIRGDRSRNIRDAFNDIQVTMLITLVLVIGVIFVFLRNASATIIPSMALPFSMLGTFAVMAVLELQPGHMSMMALILSIGFVVDDAIVMLENIVRHIEHGEEPFEAALKGSKEIGFTIISMTVSLAAVFIPILFMGGILGRLFREFAVTITVAILISGWCPSRLTPMLCSRFLQGARAGHGARLGRGPRNGASSRTAEVLRLELARRSAMASGDAGGVLRGAGADRLPVRDGADRASFRTPDKDQLQLQHAGGAGHLVSPDGEIPEAGWPTSSARIPTWKRFWPTCNNGNYNQMQITLKPRKQRPAFGAATGGQTASAAVEFRGIQGVHEHSAGHPHRGTRRSEQQLSSSRCKRWTRRSLFKWAQVMEDEIGKLPEVQDVFTDLQIKNPLMTVKIDRERAALYGLNAKQIENALYSAYGPELTSQHLYPGQSVPSAGGDAAEVSGMHRLSVQDLFQGGQRTTGAAGLAGQGDSAMSGRRASRIPGSCPR